MKKLYKLLILCILILSGGNALKAQTYNDSDSEYANRAEVPTYISKIAVAYGAMESTPKDILKDNGFTVIDYDLNKGCGSTTHYIYMGYKTTQNPSEAITGIFFRTGENPPASATFDGVTAYLLGGNGESNPGENTYVDLNADAGGSYIYTYVTRDASRAAVLQGLYFNSSNSASGYVTPNVNLNSGTGGSAIYLHYQQFSGKASATFHYLNANGSRTSSSTSVSVKHHQQAVNNTPSAPSSISYDGRTLALIGWREDNTATTAGSTPSYTYMDSKVYRAVYSANVSLIYNANGGSGAPSTQNAIQYINAGSSSIAKSNASITIPATIPTHDATKCNFSGWSTSSSATTAQYQPGNNISINTNTTLYAVWPEHNGTKTYINIGETHTYTWSCCGKSVTEDHIYDDGIDCDLCDGYPATLVDGYYQINNANELLWFAAYVNYIDKTASAKLMNDIEMNAVQWTPIGTSDAYNGTFDGQGYTINNLWHNTGVADGGREGLFTLIGSNGVVKNIVLNNATIWGGSSYGFNSCGGIAIKNQGTISNCIIAGSTIQFGNYAHFGGITGHNTGTIKNCAVRNSILRRRWGGVDNRNIGGITQTNNGTVTDCYSYDNIYEYGLTTCAISAEGNAPINSYQYTTSTVADAAETAKTKAQFASGDVAYLLQGEQATQVWGQNIDNEETAQQYPVFSNAKVYKHTFNGVTLYSNHEALTAGGKCGDNLFWNVNNNTLTIYGTGAMYDYKNSNNISPWRNLSPKPTSLVLEEGITHIGNSAFYYCSDFTGDLTIPNSVTTIGDHAFSNCYHFTGSLTIPNSVTTIGESAFEHCVSFTGSLTIGNSVTTIGDYAFYGCNGFTGSLTIGNSVTTIGDYVFFDCEGFTGSLTIPNSVTTIGNSAFYDCKGFTGSLTIPNSVTTIGNSAFDYCDGFTGDLTIPNSVTTIGNSAFSSCSGFTGSLTIGNSVTTIGDYAFSYCKGFTGSLTIPNSVTTIGNSAFLSCSGFTGSLTIPNSVTTIGNSAFYDCKGFTGSLTIPNSITTIGNYAFYYCHGFTGDLTIPNSVTTIGDHAFLSCSGFTGSLTIPNSVTTIGKYAFYNCSGLSEIFLYRDTNPTIGSYAFNDLKSSAKIYVPVIWSSYDNIPSNKLVKMATFVGQQTTDASTGSATVNGWVFPEGMTEVGENDHVAINAPLVLGSQQDNKTTRQQGSTANSLSVKSFGYCGNGTTVNGSITIEDGGQLYCEEAKGEVTVNKEIIGYAGQQSTDNSQQTVWYTIASPLKDTLLISDPQFLSSSVPQFLSSNSDLYRYDEPSYTWQNAKPGEGSTNFKTIDPGRGYLYANANDTVLEFTGMINTDEVTYNLTTDGNVLTGFHLVGNPFTHNITFAHLNATEGAELVNGYYVLNGEGAWGATLGNNEDDVIKVGQGALIKAKTAGTLAIAKSQSRKDAESQSRGQQSTVNRQQTLGITVSNAQHSDRAFVVFDKGVGLDKINHENKNIPLLYIPMDDADYAIAMMDINVNEIPVNFETNVMGQYTISLRQDNCEFDELYLLDKQTGEKVNILENGYTFIATSNDAPERFVLLKDNGQQTTDNSHFAYINNGDIVIYDINGNADIKIFDAMGRCLYKGNSSDETARIANDFSAGVYVIQKADDNGVKVQKLMID